MNALQQFKQKGRNLRKWMSKAFDTEVQLSQAYEAVAVMEGCADWNQFSARLVSSSDVLAAAPALTAPAVAPLPSIRAIIRTVDGKAVAEFDASPWFAQASEFDIAGLIEEKPRMCPIGYELSYGGKNGFSDSVAEFIAQSDEKVGAVYAYIRAVAEAGGDCGGSDCYVDAHQVQFWFMARAVATSVTESAAKKTVYDVQLHEPENAELLGKFCAHVRLEAKRRHDVGNYRPTLQSDIEDSLRSMKVIPSGDAGTFAPSVFDVARQALGQSAPVSEPEVVYEKLQMLDVMMQDYVGEYEVPETVPEWQWVQAHAAFSHRDNGKEDSGGVWEFMVNVEAAESSDDVPASLQPLFERARKHKAVWVMFHQGT